MTQTERIQNKKHRSFKIDDMTALPFNHNTRSGD